MVLDEGLSSGPSLEVESRVPTGAGGVGVSKRTGYALAIGLKTFILGQQCPRLKMLFARTRRNAS